MSTFDQFVESIARFEGFYVHRSRAQRNNNPGNLRSWGRNKIVAGYAQFPSVEAGWQALRTQCRKNIYERKLTCYEFFGGKKGVYSGYAPDSDGNHSRRYAEYVAQRCAIEPTRPIHEQIEPPAGQ